MGLASLLMATAACTQADGKYGDQLGLTGAGDAGDASADDAGVDPDEGAPIFDALPDGNDGPSGGDDGIAMSGCRNVDLLFVIDNSISMGDNQQRLVASVPGFVQAMRTELEDALGFHVGVTTTDGNYGNVPSCRGVQGSLVQRTMGANSSDDICAPYAQSQFWMSESDDLEAAFGCAALVGTGGSSDEAPMDSLLAAISPEINAVGGCNEGFLRDDAILVVVVITDEADSGSSGTPNDWYDAVVAAKGGEEKNVVALSITSDPATADSCTAAVSVAARVRQFVNMFTYGSTGDVCAPSYDAFLQNSLSDIVSACEGFVPPAG